MAERKLVLTTWQYIHDGEKQNAVWVSSVLSVVSPPPEPSGGVSAFPCDNATKIFRLPQNLLSLAFNAAKSQPHNPRVEQYLRRIYTKLVEERKNVRKALMEFLGFDDDIDFKVRVSATPSLLPKGFHTQSVFPREKPPPNRNSIAWVTPETPSFLRAPNGAALWRCVGGSRFHAA
ncbi:MAG: hypothetical protein ACO2PK_05880 [Armatimonadota bacterium]